MCLIFFFSLKKDPRTIQHTVDSQERCGCSEVGCRAFRKFLQWQLKTGFPRKKKNITLSIDTDNVVVCNCILVCVSIYIHKYIYIHTWLCMYEYRRHMDQLTFYYRVWWPWWPFIDQLILGKQHVWVDSTMSLRFTQWTWSWWLWKNMPKAISRDRHASPNKETVSEYHVHNCMVLLQVCLFIVPSLRLPQKQQETRRWQQQNPSKPMNKIHGFHANKNTHIKRSQRITRNHNTIDVLFPLFGWLIEGFTLTPLTTGNWW